MRRINQLHQLKKERQRLQVQRALLEGKLRADWKELRHSLAPSELTRQALGSGADWIRRRWFGKQH